MYKILITLALCVDIFAHTLILNVLDNGDDTITIQGVYDTGQSAANAQIRLEALRDGKVLFQQRLPDESELSVKIPTQAYKIILDGGPNHIATKQGIAPKNGFTDKKIEKISPKIQNSNLAFLISCIISTILIAFSIFFAIKNKP